MTIKIIKFIIIITIITILGKQSLYSASLSGETASEETSTPSPTDLIDKLKKIEVLKEKIATKVAEMREEEKGALTGTVKDVSESKITLSTLAGDKTFSFSEDTTCYSLKEDTKKETALKEIEKENIITVFGYYDQEKTTLSAKYIYLESPPVRIRGKIVDIDKTNYTITVKEKQGEVVVDVEKYTKASLFDRKNKNFVSAGFSKMESGDITHILADPNTKTENKQVSARNIYLLRVEKQVEITPSEKPKSSSPSATPVEK